MGIGDHCSCCQFYLVINIVGVIICRFACMNPASITIVPDIKLPTVDGRQLSPENCVSSNKEVQSSLTKKFEKFLFISCPEFVLLLTKNF